jgi:hypothetical protein
MFELVVVLGSTQLEDWRARPWDNAAVFSGPWYHSGNHSCPNASGLARRRARPKSALAPALGAGP